MYKINIKKFIDLLNKNSNQLEQVMEETILREKSSKECPRAGSFKMQMLMNNTDQKRLEQKSILVQKESTS